MSLLAPAAVGPAAAAAVPEAEAGGFRRDRFLPRLGTLGLLGASWVVLSHLWRRGQPTGQVVSQAKVSSPCQRRKCCMT